MSKRVAITGSSGFVGQALVQRFANAGWKVIAMQRKLAAPSDSIRFVPFELNKPFPEDALQDIDLLVHGAWQPFSQAVPQSDEINIEGTRRLQQFAHRAGAKFIFISTLSAHAQATSHYGISKLKAEALMNPQKDLVIKSGLVIGNEGGLFRKIAGIIAKSKFIPMVDGGRQPMQTIWVDDLFRVIVKSYETQLCGNYAAAESDAITMKQLYQMMAEKNNVNPVFISIPYPVMYAVMRLSEMLHLPLPLTIENLKGLKQLRPFDTREIQQKLGIKLLSAREAIDKVYS